MIKKKEIKVFLGGTCDGPDWRKELIKDLKMPYFNPVVDNWTEECRIIEEKEKKKSAYLLFVITNDIKGVYSIAEMIDHIHRAAQSKDTQVIFCNLYNASSTKAQKQMAKSLQAVEKLVTEIDRKVYVSHNLDDVRWYLNYQYHIINAEDNHNKTMMRGK